MTRADFQRLAKCRIADARAMLAARRWAAAYYLAGYAVECALKACIAKQIGPEEFPDKAFTDKCWTHNLVQLLTVAELKADLDTAMQITPELAGNWDIVKEWKESSRYSLMTKSDAEDLYDAITDKKHGVFSWFKHRW